MNLAGLVLVCCALAASEKFYVEFKGDGEKGARPRHGYDITSAIYKKSVYLHSYANFNYNKNEGASKNIELPFTKDVFDTFISLLEDKVGGIPDMGPHMMHQLMYEGELLNLPEEEMSLVYKNLWSKSLLGEHGEAILRTNMSVFDSEGFPPAMLYVRLFRTYAGMCKTWVGVEEDTATVCPRKDDEYGSDEIIPPPEIRSVRILPAAFDKLLESLGSGAAPTNPEAVAGPSSGMKVNGWDVLSWILVQMAVSSLDMDGCRMGRDHVARIARLGELRILSLNRCGLQPGDVQPIGALTKLLGLYVNYNALSRDDASVVASIVSLVILHIHGCHLRADDLLHINDLQHLEELDVSGCWLSESDIPKIASLIDLRT